MKRTVSSLILNLKKLLSVKSAISCYWRVRRRSDLLKRPVDYLVKYSKMNQNKTADIKFGGSRCSVR